MIILTLVALKEKQSDKVTSNTFYRISMAG